MPLTIDDVTAIQQLYARYCHTLDDGDGEAFSACFTPEGSLGGAGGSVAGREKLERFATKIAASGRNLRHLNSGIWIEGDGDEAVGRAYLLAYSGSGPTPEFLSSGRYRDSLRRVDGAWLFVQRDFTPDA